MSVTEHLYLDKQHPDLWKAISSLGLKVQEAAETAGIGRNLLELLNVRISQINGCAYCLDLHVRRAGEAGESPQRLAVLPAWRETALFTEKERAALALAESITELPAQQARDHAEGLARECLTAEEFSAVSWLAVTMNAFNRVSITSHHPVRRDRA
ncbi:carboxymuconolactone decarboxylase family protein [Arthrobacter sp. NQ7]|uniref:carboxymuconolactone decarboxylase family protein n=1 Tax=Arthrobacter sp. NQ7 TaxID=3032303 RepID=UPI00240FF9D6|nr:carboxymuconolactone decarboxylase family protein [Arthrobacter sp. NQ7]MDJ0458403.1 carboxymuconolactone decarboxylase family protein [Arthrobacter sp. NQ7]